MNRLLNRLFLGAIALFMASPIIILLGVSVNAEKRLAFPPQGFSLRWYLELWNDAGWHSAISNSLLIASLAALLATSIAAPLAYGLWQTLVRASALFSG